MSDDDLNLRHLPADTVTPDAQDEPPTDLKIGWVAGYAAYVADDDEGNEPAGSVE